MKEFKLRKGYRFTSCHLRFKPCVVRGKTVQGVEPILLPGLEGLLPQREQERCPGSSPDKNIPRTGCSVIIMCCMFKCVSVCVRRPTCIHMVLGVGESLYFLNHFPPYCLRQGLSLNLKLTNSIRLTACRLPESICLYFLPPVLELRLHTVVSALMWVLEVRIWVLVPMKHTEPLLQPWLFCHC